MKTFATSVAWAVLLGQSVVSFGSGQGALGRKMERSGSWGPATYCENARWQLIVNTYASGERCLSDSVRRTSSPAPDPWSDNVSVTLSVSTPTTSQQFPLPENQEVTLVAEQVFGENIRFKAIELQASQRASLEKALGPQPAKALIDEIQKQSKEGHWDKVIDSLDSVYDLDVADLDKATWKVFDLIDKVAMLKLFEGNPTSLKYNPCYSFCTSRLLREYFCYPGSDNGDPNKVLQTAGVYLYALGNFLSGEKKPEQYGPCYQKAIRSLVTLEGAEKRVKHPIKWAIQSAIKDKDTRDYVRECNPEPSFW